MTWRARDRVVGAFLILLAAVWCTVVWMTVPSGYGDALVGPRDVPFWLGIGLIVFSLVMIARSYLAGTEETEAEPPAAADRKSEWLAIAAVTGSLIAYALLMDWFGYVIATIIVVVGLLRFALGVRSLRVIAGMALGMSFGVYFVMGSLMGVYLPHGNLIALF
jgi:putative tricarboxylic transport membrane protein